MHTHTQTLEAGHTARGHLKFGRVALAAAILLMASASAAQPDRRRGDAKPTDRAAQRERPQRETDRRTDTQPEADRFRARLASMLEQLDASAEHLRGAIETLDADGSVDDAIEQLGCPMRVRRMAEMWAQWRRPGELDRPVRDGADGRPMQRGFGGGPSDQPRGPWGARSASPEEILAFLREQAPQLAKRLDALRKDDQHRADGILGRLGPRISEILLTRAHDAELADLLTQDFHIGMQVSEVGGLYARALAAGEDERAAALKDELRTLAAQQVDLRLARREHEISRFVARLESLQGEVEAQRGKREQLIDEVIERAGQGRFRGPPGDRPGRGNQQRSERGDRRNSADDR